MLPLYRPGTKPPSLQVTTTNLQRRVVHNISQPLFPSTTTTTDLSSSPREEPLFVMNNNHHQTKRNSIGWWIGGSVIVFWIILVTLFFISHLAASPARHAPGPRYQSVSFSMLPTQGRFFNVSLEKLQGGGGPAFAVMGWHRTCCHKGEEHHCDGSGMFSVHVEKQSLVVRVIQPDIIGAQCTFHAWSSVATQ